MGRQSHFEGECVVDDVSATGTNDLRVGAECIGVRLPVVPSASDEDFFVECQVFHLNGSDDCRLRLLDDDVLQ